MDWPKREKTKNLQTLIAAPAILKTLNAMKTTTPPEPRIIAKLTQVPTNYIPLFETLNELPPNSKIERVEIMATRPDGRAIHVRMNVKTS